MDHTEQIELPQVKKAGLHRRLYNWTLHWAHTPYGSVALFALAFCESSFFPIPPDVLLMALALSLPKKSFKYAAICSVGSVLGGCFGYFIGYQFFEHIGLPILNLYGVMDKFNYVKDTYNANAFTAVAISGFTPIPYKVLPLQQAFARLISGHSLLHRTSQPFREIFCCGRACLPFWTENKEFYRQIL